MTKLIYHKLFINDKASDFKGRYSEAVVYNVQTIKPNQRNIKSPL